jgi:hypothetical protein
VRGKEKNQIKNIVCSARKLYKVIGVILINSFAIIMNNFLSFYKEQCADNVKGLPDTNIEFNDNGVDHNPTKKKTNKFLKVGKIAWQALKSARKTFPVLAKDLVNE